MQQLNRLAIVSVVGVSSIFTINGSVVSARTPPLSAVFLGGNEVSKTGTANAGDPDGVGGATVKITKLNNSKARVCFGITIAGIDKPILAHIHKGAAGTNGPIVVSFIPPVNGFAASSGCVDVPLALGLDIETDPLNYYVNVHSEKFPAGVVRGQLF